MRNIRIIGAGIIGLATAWRLTDCLLYTSDAADE